MHDLTAGGWISVPLAFVILATILVVNILRTPPNEPKDKRRRGSNRKRVRENRSVRDSKSHHHDGK